MLMTTYNKCKEAGACEDGLDRAEAHFDGDEEVLLGKVLGVIGLDDTLWVLEHACGEEGQKVARAFGADCAERVLPIFEKEHPDDDRPRKAVEAARTFNRGEITVEELEAAAAALSARSVTWSAAWSAAAVTLSARSAAAVAAALSASAASAAAVAWTTAGEREWQENHLLELLAEETV